MKWDADFTAAVHLLEQAILFVEAYRFDEAYGEKVRKRSGRKMEALLEKLIA